MSDRVVVSDSSVLIDLERGSLFAPAFALPLECCVPDLLYRRELEPYGGARLLDMGLKVLDLDSAAVGRAMQYRRTVPALSLPDAFALALAQHIQGTLLTGDGRLRRLADSERVPCHGLLWLVDCIYSAHAATPRQLYDGLVAIRNHPRCRLPKRETDRRLRIFDPSGRGAP